MKKLLGIVVLSLLLGSNVNASNKITGFCAQETLSPYLGDFIIYSTTIYSICNYYYIEKNDEPELFAHLLKIQIKKQLKTAEIFYILRKDLGKFEEIILSKNPKPEKEINERITNKSPDDNKIVSAGAGSGVINLDCKYSPEKKIKKFKIDLINEMVDQAHWQKGSTNKIIKVTQWVPLNGMFYDAYFFKINLYSEEVYLIRINNINIWDPESQKAIKNDDTFSLIPSNPPKQINLKCERVDDAN